MSSYRSEECDDSNLIDGDGCSKKCHKEMGFNCKGKLPLFIPIYVQSNHVISLIDSGLQPLILHVIDLTKH